ncbi:hypothetical protein Pan110_07460 [Gimesia panareensis]|nr:hypothetical protein Pan110_07460 [Gimesia panareensis]
MSQLEMDKSLFTLDQWGQKVKRMSTCRKEGVKKGDGRLQSGKEIDYYRDHFQTN